MKLLEFHDRATTATGRRGLERLGIDSYAEEAATNAWQSKAGEQEHGLHGRSYRRGARM
jgi:hypothetical protein